MQHVALKSFGWYPDGYTREEVSAGTKRDFGDAAEGMVDAGMIGSIAEDADTVAPPESDAAPDNDARPRGRKRK